MKEPFMKKCCCCGIIKSFDSFSRDSHVKSGRKGQCRRCVSVYNKKRRQEKLDENRRYTANKQREYRRDFPNSEKRRISKWKTENPEKVKAKDALNGAVRYGRIKKKVNCENCGVTGRIHAHHDDYTKPLNVVWLCPVCHKSRHAAMSNEK